MSGPEGVPIRDRIREFRRVPSAELLDNARNWRRHPQAQRDALAGMLGEVGIAGALLAYHSERNGGALTIIDGHLRHGDFPAVAWPTVVLDVTDAEADLLLATHDPLAAMAQADAVALEGLLREVSTGDAAVQQMLSELAAREQLLTERVEPTSPDEFQEYDETVGTAYKCPRCAYEWSGQPR